MVGRPHLSSQKVNDALIDEPVCFICHIYLNLSVRSLVRILKDMQRHVPGLQHLEPWYIQMLVSGTVLAGV